MVGRDWKRLARYVRSRRVDLGYGTTRQLAGALGISERTIGNLERGQSVSSSTIAAVENRLGWVPGSADAVLAGGEPQVLGLADRSGPASAVTAARRRILEASPDQLVEIMLLVQEVQGQDAAAAWMERAIRMREEAAASARTERDAG